MPLAMSAYVCHCYDCTYIVYDAFEHWKNLVKLLCSCEEALSTHKELFSSFICTYKLLKRHLTNKSLENVEHCVGEPEQADTCCLLVN